MSRPYRLQAEDVCYHITSRGNNRSNIFLVESDKKKFLEYVLKAKEKYSFYVYTYVLMTNHYHLLIETSKPNISRIMQFINTSYTTYYNVKHRKCGHLFQGRFKSIVIQIEQYFLELTRYIHLNPVRAKIVQLPEEYQWSSFYGYLNRQGDGIIDKDKLQNYLTMSAVQYKDFVHEGIGKKIELFKNVYAGFILGTTQYIKDILAELKDQIDWKEVSYKEDLGMRNKIGIDEIINGISKKYKINPQNLYKPNKKKFIERNLAIYIIKKLTECTNTEIGKKFNLSYSAVSKVVADVEKQCIENKNIRNDFQSMIHTFKV